MSEDVLEDVVGVLSMELETRSTTTSSWEPGETTSARPTTSFQTFFSELVV